MKKLLVTVLVLASLPILAFFGGRLGVKIAHELNLTPEQAQRLSEIRHQNDRTKIDLRHDIEVKRLDLKDEMEKDNPNISVVDKLVDELAALRARIMKAGLHKRIEMKKILTPDQEEKLEQLIRERGRQERKQGEKPRRFGENQPPMPPEPDAPPIEDFPLPPPDEEML